MPPDVRHLFVSPVAAGTSNRLVQGPNWNETHNLQQGPQALLGRSDSTPGQAATQEVLLDPATMTFTGGKLATLGGSSAINAKDYGAIGDWNDTTQTGTDNGAAINAALQYAASIGGGDVLLPVATTGTQSNSTGYYTTQTIIVPARCRLLGAGSQSTISSAVRIVGALALATIVLCDGGSGGRATGLINLGITRANGTVPDTSVGVKVQRSHYAHLERVLSMRSAYAYQVDNSTVGTLLRECFSTVVHKAHVLWTQGPMLTLDNCSFGLSGLDVACEAYIRIDLSAYGGVGCDSLNVIRTQFNESPVGVGTLLDFKSYADPNGFFRFTNSHCEGLAVGTSNVITADAATTIIRNITFESTSIARATASPGPWFNLAGATTLRGFSFQNSWTSIDMNLPGDAASIFQIGDSTLTGAFSCTGANTLIMSGNTFIGTTTLSGAITVLYADSNHFSAAYTDTSTSTKTGFFNGKIAQKSLGSNTAVNHRSQLPITGSAVAYHTLLEPTIQSDVTTQANVNVTSVGTANSVFTVPALRHYSATQAAFGASSTVTTQQAFYAHTSVTGATNNYGFYSDVPVGANNYSFFGNSTAQSKFNGPVLLATFTVATLPTAASSVRARAFVSDSTVVAAGNFGAVVAGTGANIVPVYSDGTNWRIG